MKPCVCQKKKREGSQVLKKSMSSIAAATMKKRCKLVALIEQKVKAASFVSAEKPRPEAKAVLLTGSLN